MALQCVLDFPLSVRSVIHEYGFFIYLFYFIVEEVAGRHFWKVGPIVRKDGVGMVNNLFCFCVLWVFYALCVCVYQHPMAHSCSTVQGFCAECFPLNASGWITAVLTVRLWGKTLHLKTAEKCWVLAGERALITSIYPTEKKSRVSLKV